MVIKQQITAILSKEMDRQDFLKHVAIGLVALTGASAALRMLAPQIKSTGGIDGGYGASAYGGSDDGLKR